jgi:hypothetical protein
MSEATSGVSTPAANPGYRYAHPGYESWGKGKAADDRPDPGRHDAGSLNAELAANSAFWQPIVKATGYKITN